MSEDPAPSDQPLPGGIADKQLSPKSKADTSSTAKPGQMESEIASLQEEARQALKVIRNYYDQNPMPWRTPPKK